MVNVHRFPSQAPSTNAVSHDGAACISYYDPYTPRTLETIKIALGRKQPLLVRLHGGAEYYASSRSDIPRNQIDIEGHAVLLVGYDDVQKKLAYLDPWAQEEGSEQEIRWMDYETFCINIVDYTNGILLGAAPPKIDYRDLIRGGQRWLEVKAGFDSLPGRIMDRENFHISSAEVVVIDRHGQKIAQERVDGTWYAGMQMAIHLPLEDNPADPLQLKVRLSVTGARPYPFCDQLTSTTVLRNQARKALRSA